MGTLEVNFRTQIAEEMSRMELIDRLCEYHERIKQLEEQIESDKSNHFDESLTEQCPHVCPVCCGRQYAPMGFYDGGMSSAINTELCRTCGGIGIVWKPLNQSK